MAAELRRPARCDRADHPPLDAADMPGMIAQIGLAMTAQHFGDLDHRPVRGRSGAGHDRRRALAYPGGMTSSDSRSNGLCVARIVWVATCV